MSPTQAGPAAPATVDPAAEHYGAVADLYHAWLTGLLLMTVSRRGAAPAAELVFRTFRHQHLEKFLPGLAKLGLDALPDAVACAQYHYLSNHLGGVKVEYAYESDRKAWIRYPPPRWIFEGTAICGIPSEVSRAMLRGWHAHNGVSLGNPRLGFVCTKQTVDGQPGLEGYYLEHDRDLQPEERLRFAPGEEAPAVDPARLPALDAADWPEERLQKVLRNYAMDYMRTALPITVELFGPAGLAARQIGMQLHDRIARRLPPADDEIDFLDWLATLLRAQGDPAEVEGEGASRRLVQRGWRLMRDRGPLHAAVFEAWRELWAGMLLARDPRGRLEASRSQEDRVVWRLGA